MYDAMRTAMNFGMDYYLFGVDAERQQTLAKRLIDFFEKDGYKHARFNWDGTNPSEQYTTGEVGCNAVACYALMNMPEYKDIIKKNLQMAWNVKPMTGQYRYYDGIVHYLAMLHLCGSFKIWKPRAGNITTDISNASPQDKVQNDEWYSIDGRKLNGKPNAKGIYIHNGKKAIVN